MKIIKKIKWVRYVYDSFPLNRKHKPLFVHFDNNLNILITRSRLENIARDTTMKLSILYNFTDFHLLELNFGGFLEN